MLTGLWRTILHVILRLTEAVFLIGSWFPLNFVEWTGGIPTQLHNCSKHNTSRSLLPTCKTRWCMNVHNQPTSPRYISLPNIIHTYQLHLLLSDGHGYTHPPLSLLSAILSRRSSSWTTYFLSKCFLTIFNIRCCSGGQADCKLHVDLEGLSLETV